MHKQVCKAAKTNLNRALKAGDKDGVMAWSIVLSRHTRDILGLMQFKRLVLLDTDGLVGSKISSGQGTPQPVISNSQ